MSRLTDLIRRQETTPNRTRGGRKAFRGLVLHIAQGTYEGTIAWQCNPDSDVSSEFVVGREPGEWAQMMDLDDYGWTQIDGNGYWVASENAGYVADGLTDWQVEANARLLAWLHVHEGVPLAVADNPSERGLGHHSMDRDWLGERWGHEDCPGPQVLARKREIVARAVEIANGDDMYSEAEMRALPWQYAGRGMPGVPADHSTLWVLGTIYSTTQAILARLGGDPVDEEAIVAGVLAGLGSRSAAEVAQALVAAGQDPAALAEALTALVEG